MVKAEQLCFRFPEHEIPILQDITLTIRPGRTLIQGDSGSGKSTLLALFNRLYPENCDGILDGTLELFDRAYDSYVPGEVSRRVGTVFQDPDTQFVMQTVEEELIFTLENHRFPVESIDTRIDDVLGSLGLGAFRTRQLAELSGGQKQQIAVACALVAHPEWLLLDEPLTHLDPETASRFVDWLGKQTLVRHVIVIDHRPAMWGSFFDWHVQLECGMIQSHEPFTPQRDYRFQPSRPNAGSEERYHLNRIERESFVLAADDWFARKGEVVVILGPNGSGKSTWLHQLATSNRTVGLVPQSPEHLFLETTVEAELRFGHDRPIEAVARKMRLDHVLTRGPFSLSHGQKRRLAIAIMMLSDKQLLAFDEPTAGQDEASLRALHDLMVQRAEGGQTIVVVTHDLSFATIGHTFYTMEQGRLRQVSRQVVEEKCDVI